MNFHLHHRAEDTGLHGHTLGAELFHEVVDQRFGFFGPRRIDEVRAAAALRVGVERELRHDERFALHIQQREIHLPRFILEHAQIGDFVGQPLGLGGCVAVFYSDQNAQARATAPDDLISRR